MIPIPSAEMLRAADAHTMASEPIASIDLMERAASRCTTWLIERRSILFSSSADPRALILAGPGNNGGDGLAIARQLAMAGWAVRVLPCCFGAAPSADRAANLHRLAGTGVELMQEPDPQQPPGPLPGEVVVDALFGIGLSRPLGGVWKHMVKAVNGWSAVVVSIDLPSGLFATDNSDNDPDAIIRAHHVLTFQCPKLAMLLPESASCVPAWTTLDIGLDQGFLKALNTRYILQEVEDLVGLLPPRPRQAHKGTFGHALLVVGGKGRFGAGVMAARACTRSGAGLVTVALPEEGAPIIHTTVPEAMVYAKSGSWVPKELAPYRAIGVGPGMGLEVEQANALKSLIQNTTVPLVIDADAITILANNPTWCAFLPPGSIITPHPGEFDRLAGVSKSGYERLQRAIEWSLKCGVIVVLKGAYTAVIEVDGSVCFNQFGNSGMAKGGSGDVLTGLLTGLLAQGLSPVGAAKLAVHLHAKAGDAAASSIGMEAMTPGDLVDKLPAAFSGLRSFQ